MVKIYETLRRIFPPLLGASLTFGAPACSSQETPEPLQEGTYMIPALVGETLHEDSEAITRARLLVQNENSCLLYLDRQDPGNFATLIDGGCNGDVDAMFAGRGSDCNCGGSFAVFPDQLCNDTDLENSLNRAMNTAIAQARTTQSRQE